MSGRSVDASVADAAFREFVSHTGYSCLAARGVVRTAGYRHGVYGALGSRGSARRLAVDLTQFATALPRDGAGLHAFVAVFPAAAPRDEAEFEARLWLELRRLHVEDRATAPWDPSVSDDPDDPRFSFSFGARAMFVVGLHPYSSRVARRFAWPTLVFNPRAQFERLRAEGKFERLRSSVRDREIALQGSLNPNLADFGEGSDARQYSGRKTDASWQCPFDHRT